MLSRALLPGHLNILTYTRHVHADTAKRSIGLHKETREIQVRMHLFQPFNDQEELTILSCIIHCESKKNGATIIFTVTLANVGRFLKFFQCRNQKEMAHNTNEKFPTVA